MKLQCEDSGDNEWCIVEFQGELLGDLAPCAEVGEVLAIKVRIVYDVL